MHAARNISLCTKDCVCLYVCPTGATDTENGQIDFAKCLSGCRLCVDACPSHALYLVPDSFPSPQPKNAEVAAKINKLAASKCLQERMARAIADQSNSQVEKKVAQALAKSNRLMAEDLMREAGYMLPQSNQVRELLHQLRDGNQDESFPADVVETLLEKL